MKAPQIIMIVLFAITLVLTAEKYGEPKGNYNFWVTLLCVLVEVWILIWGGFFK